MKKDKTGSNEFVLAAYDEKGNLILAAQGNEVLHRNVARLASMRDFSFALHDESGLNRTVLGFHRTLNSALPVPALVDALNMLKGWIANDDKVNARVHDELVSRGIVPNQDTAKAFLISLADLALRVRP